MPDEIQKERHAPHVLTTLAGVLIAFLLLAAIYVVYQAAHILFPQNVYETALPAVISDTVEADGVLLFDESYVAGSGNLGYLAADGERVSAGTAVAEVYSNASQASLRLQLNQLNDQIDLLQKSQNTSALQLDTLLKERSSALYDLLDTLDDSDYEAVDDDANAYLLGPEQALGGNGRSSKLYRSDHCAGPAVPERAGAAGQPGADHCTADRLFCALFQQRTAQCQCR